MTELQIEITFDILNSLYKKNITFDDYINKVKNYCNANAFDSELTNTMMKCGKNFYNNIK